MPGLTFVTIRNETASQLGDSSSDTQTIIDRAINQGLHKFNAILRREWRRTEKTFSTVADQQYYQMPEDCIRIKSVTITIGGIAYPLEVIEDEHTWRLLNETTTSSDVPEYFYIKGRDQFGIFPIPSTSTANAGTLNYEPKMRDMSQAEYATGTVSTTAGDATVTGVGTTFTSAMVGRVFKIDDPDGDGQWYKIDTFTSTTSIELENYYPVTTSSKSYVISEYPDIPEEFHEALVDYALYRLYMRRKDRSEARFHKSNFDEALAMCREDYSSTTSSNYYRPPKFTKALYKHVYRDQTVTGS